MTTTLLSQMKVWFALAISLTGIFAATAQTPAAGMPAKIEALRKQRETAISEAITKANADYAAALERMKTLCQ